MRTVGIILPAASRSSASKPVVAESLPNLRAGLGSALLLLGAGRFPLFHQTVHHLDLSPAWSISWDAARTLVGSIRAHDLPDAFYLKFEDHRQVLLVTGCSSSGILRDALLSSGLV
jgi:hypothetical protein